MATTELILAHADAHTHLSIAISELYYVSSQLPQQAHDLEKLKAERDGKTREIKTLSEVAMKRRKTVNGLRGNSMRRLSYQLAGKRANLEKNEAHAVKQKETELRERQIALDSMVLAASEKQDEMIAKELELENFRVELDELYELVFGRRPTEEFPRNEELKMEIGDLQATMNRIHDDLSLDYQAIDTLHQAEQLMKRCLTKMDYAVDLYHQPAFFAQDGYTSINDNPDIHIRDAGSLASKGQILLEEAQMISPRISIMDPLPVQELMLFGLTKPVPTDNDIVGYKAQLEATSTQLTAQIEELSQRCEASGLELASLIEKLSLRRHELFQFRRKTFLEVVVEQRTSLSANPSPSSGQGSSLPTIEERPMSEFYATPTGDLNSPANEQRPPLPKFDETMVAVDAVMD